MTTHLAIIGFGRLGRACAEAISSDDELVLAGIVRRAESVTKPLPPKLQGVAVASHISELARVDAALVCVPQNVVLGVAHDLMQQRMPVVECAAFHGDEFRHHKDELERMAELYKTPALVGAGWDPGALSLIRGVFEMLTPKGHIEAWPRPGVSLHHSTVAAAVEGVRGALSTEILSAEGKPQRYVYVELEPGADPDRIAQQIRNEPLFLEQETLVFPVDSVATLEEEGQGLLLQRKGMAAGKAHQLLLLEARFSREALAAQIMTAAAKALSGSGHRAYSLFDLPLGALWGMLRSVRESEVI